MKLKFLEKRKKLKIAIYILLILFAIGLIFTSILICRYGFNKVYNKGKSILKYCFSYTSNNINIMIDNITGKNSIYKNIDKNNIKQYYYIDNVYYDKFDIKDYKNKDIKSIIECENISRFINYPDGYYIDLPINIKYDFCLSKDVIKTYNNNMSIDISLERSPYEDVKEYINYYQNRFYLDENYQKNNNLILNEYSQKNVNNHNIIVLSLTRNTEETYSFNTYTYVYILLEKQNYLRLMFKTNSYSNELINTYNKSIDSFVQIPKRGISKYYVNLQPIVNMNWNSKTNELYTKYLNSSNIDWGIFPEDVTTTAIYDKVPKLEKELDYSFDIILLYNHLGNELPIEIMKEIALQNKKIELTVQTCYYNNEKLFDYTPMFDIIDGKKDEQIIKLAKQIKEVDSPILFRLNNEMNSDWTSYSGIICLSDPDIYIKIWKRIYDIFQKEGVNNCIWIFNPNDNNYPPCRWNNFLRYYPGNEYVHLIGITGYNTGTYYKDVTGEQWKEFKNIYDEINKKYIPLFEKFPWIITEFACSSIGGDKSKWIIDMFDNISNYPNIKVAVWFNSADYDLRDENNIKIARPYWLDENENTLSAFRNGLRKFKN